jgi:hypothetical protein
LKSPRPESSKFKPPTPNPCKPAPKSNAKPNKSGTNHNSLPPKVFSRLKEAAPQSNWCAPPNLGLPKRGTFDPVREWKNEERLDAELPNREFPKFEVPRLRSKKEVDFNAFAEGICSLPDQLREAAAAFGGRFELKEEVDRGALAKEDWPCPGQLLGADAALGGRLALKEDGDLGGLAMENWPCPDQLREDDAAFGGRFELKVVDPDVPAHGD